MTSLRNVCGQNQEFEKELSSLFSQAEVPLMIKAKAKALSDKKFIIKALKEKGIDALSSFEKVSSEIGIFLK